MAIRRSQTEVDCASLYSGLRERGYSQAPTIGPAEVSTRSQQLIQDVESR